MKHHQMGGSVWKGIILQLDPGILDPGSADGIAVVWDVDFGMSISARRQHVLSQP